MTSDRIVHKTKPFWATKNGVSLVVVLGGALFVSAVIGGFSLHVDNRARARSVDDLKKNRDLAYNTILQSSRDASALLVSTEDSTELNRCISQPNRCPYRSEAQRQRFPLSQQITDRKVQLTAQLDTNTSGMFNRFGGKNCNSNQNCAMIGTTEFWLDCGAGDNCEDKGFIRVRVEVMRNPSWSPSVTDEGAIAKILSRVDFGVRASGGKRPDLTDRLNEDSSVSIAELKRIALQKCPVGAWLVKLDENGRAVCKCSGFYQADPANPGRCKRFSECPAVWDGTERVSTVWVGMETVTDSSGHTTTRPKCEPVTNLTSNCRTKKTSGGRSVRFECPTRGFITKALPEDECYVPRNSKKKGNAPVYCPPWTITCCRLP
jgi:hypothetical protein